MGDYRHTMIEDKMIIWYSLHDCTSCADTLSVLDSIKSLVSLKPSARANNLPIYYTQMFKKWFPILATDLISPTTIASLVSWYNKAYQRR